VRNTRVIRAAYSDRVNDSGPAAPRNEWGRFETGSVERAALVALGERFGVDVRPRHLRLADGSRTEIEGASKDGSLVVQLVIRTGDFTSQHRNKLMADMFKLTWVRTCLTPGARAVLCIGTGALPAFRTGSWLRRAAADVGLEVLLWDAGGLHALPDAAAL
jgi:hypothetical protein